MTLRGGTSDTKIQTLCHAGRYGHGYVGDPIGNGGADPTATPIAAPTATTAASNPTATTAVSEPTATEAANEPMRHYNGERPDR